METSGIEIFEGSLGDKSYVPFPLYTQGTESTFDVSNEPSKEGLVGWWRFEGNAEDSSGNGNDGTTVKG